MIHVCFGLYDKTGRYSKFTGTTICSLFANTTSSVTVHILHDNTLTTDNRDKFIYLAGKYGQRVEFHNVEIQCAGKIFELRNFFPQAEQSRYSLATFYRFLIPQLLPSVDKVIYLDSDIIVNLDIVELWRIELGDKPLAAAAEEIIDPVRLKNSLQMKYLINQNLVAYGDYFNAGVLLMNLKFLRGDEGNINHGFQFLNEHPQMVWLDQDVLNYLYAKDYVKLSERFDVFVDVERTKSRVTRPAIYHYAVQALNLDMNDPFNRLWMNHFIKTPWFDVDAIGRIFAGIQQLNISLRAAMKDISANVIGKTRVFVDIPPNRDSVRQFFRARDDEEVIIFENQSSVQNLIDAMNISRGKKIFFIMLPNFPFDVLIREGFIAGADFVNGREFLSEAQGVPLNSHMMIQSM